MLYRRTPELPPLRKISNGVVQEYIFPDLDTQEELSAGELFLKSIWLETSLTKNENGSLPVDASNAKTIVSRKYNADMAFKNSQNEISAIYSKITNLTTKSIDSKFISTDSLSSDTMFTDNITAENGNFTFLDSDEISTDYLSVDNGKIVDLSGTYLIYENGTITALSATDINTTNITATGVADLSAAATYWADLAELYRSNETYEPGTLVRFAGEKEIEIASDGIANAVVSKNPALLMNASLKNKGICNPIILVGRSVVKVKGKIEKFDRIELSDIPGVAQKYNDKQILGISLESKFKDEIEPIECIVKLMI